MFKPIAWDAEFAPDGEIISETSLGLESFIGMGPEAGEKVPSTSKPINIVTDEGVNYATLYVCHCMDGTIGSQQIAMWLASLKETDQVVLTVLSMRGEIPLACLVNLLTALTSTKARLSIKLDHIVNDFLAYFYLIPETVLKGTEGALFIPSYVMHRDQDDSGPMRAILDFFKWITSEAVGKGILTEEEADRLQRGSHVVVPNNRFEKA